jgi:hypothetical protein
MGGYWLRGSGRHRLKWRRFSTGPNSLRYVATNILFRAMAHYIVLQASRGQARIRAVLVAVVAR